MSYLYLDESGNLGHQFQQAGVSRHFVIMILEVPDEAAQKAIEKAVERTMKNKVRGKSRLQRNRITELKGAKTSFVVKQYFYSQVANIPLDIFHDDSQQNKPIQAVDLFAWGVYRKYENNDTEWYEVFRSKVVYEQIYPK